MVMSNKPLVSYLDSLFSHNSLYKIKLRFQLQSQLQTFWQASGILLESIRGLGDREILCMFSLFTCPANAHKFACQLVALVMIDASSCCCCCCLIIYKVLQESSSNARFMVRQKQLQWQWQQALKQRWQRSLTDVAILRLPFSLPPNQLHPVQQLASSKWLASKCNQCSWLLKPSEA